MYYIGLDVGGTKCAVSLGQENGTELAVLDKKVFPTAGKTPEEIMNLFLEQSELVLNAAGIGYSQVSGIGISCGGPLDAKRGIVLSPPHLPGWDEIHIKEFFENATGVKTLLQNDANACAVAEWKFGAGQGCDNVIFLTFGTGFGAGLILDGHLYSGTSDMAGEIGHVRLTDDGPVSYGKAGCCESYCSGAGIAEIGKIALREAVQRGENPILLQKAGDESRVTAKLIGDLADEGDAMCLEIYRSCGEKLGRVLSILVDLINPERIIIGGVFMRSAHLMVSAMQEVMQRECLPHALNYCTVVPAGLGEQVGDYAALSLAVLAAEQ